ncbi:osmoprotectant transport system permease protein [Streptacidiphilus sp. MAP12-33]|uniref:ABC transporter permease n=1 Tax=Streptacidiphilus sp. MAP12-33 TaxID=3156266 RepID=UPI00351478C9
MNLFGYAQQFFDAPGRWSGADGIPNRLLEHTQYSALALLIAMLIALPVGLITGHTGRGGNVLAVLATAARALPSFGLLVLLTLLMGLGMTPVMVPLVALAVPPILVTTYEAMRSVDPSLVDAAQGMGLPRWRVLCQVELPVALPLILSGIRSGAIQIVATATIAAYVSFGGLGRYIVDGLSQVDYAKVVGGAVLVAALALATLGVFWLLGRVLVSPGVRRGR